MRLNNGLTVMVVLISLFSLAGCDKVTSIADGGNPSESDAKNIVLDYYKPLINSGRVVVENFKKTDGQAMDQFGVKLYNMTVEITVKYPKGMPAVAPGTLQTISHRITFEKSEKGWHGRW